MKKRSFAIGAGIAFLGIVICAVAVLAATSGTLLPNADGSYSQLTPKSGSTHYVMVDEASCNGTTDYNYTNTVGRRDSYQVNLTSIPDGATINFISLTPCASANKFGSSVMNVFYRWNGADSADAGNYTISGITPTNKTATVFNDLFFVKSSVSTLEIGAVLTSGSKGLRLGRIAAVIDYTPLAAPADLGALASGTSIYLFWTDNSSNETEFVIERSLTASGTFSVIDTVVANTTYYPDSGLTPGQTYYYRVKAINDGGSSDYSDIAFASIIPLPAAPTNLNTCATGTSIALVWTDNATNETGFVIERSLTSSGTFSIIDTVAANTTYYVNNDLTPGQTYYYRVKATNSAGDSSYSNIAYATINSAPAAPTNLNTFASSTSIYLWWTDNSSNETSFVIERRLTASGTFEVLNTTAANVNYYADNDLTPGQTYYYRVKANNSVGDSSYSNIAYATIIISLPAAPTNLYGFSSSTSIYLFWTDNATNETGFKMEKSWNGFDFYQISLLPADRTYFFDTASSSGIYYYRVRAYNDSGNSDYSSTTAVMVY